MSRLADSNPSVTQNGRFTNPPTSNYNTRYPDLVFGVAVAFAWATGRSPLHKPGIREFDIARRYRKLVLTDCWPLSAARIQENTPVTYALPLQSTIRAERAIPSFTEDWNTSEVGRAEDPVEMRRDSRCAYGRPRA